MTYTADVPTNNQTLGNSRPIINSNFTVLQTAFDANHQDFNLSNAGAHTHADLLVQSSDPNPSTGLVSHYSKTTAGATEWTFQRENSGAVIQMSTQYGIPSVMASGQTFLPGGLVFKWGTYSSTTSGTTVTFATAFANAIFSVVVTAYGTNTTSYDAQIKGVPTVAGFVGATQASGVLCYYMAIGW